MERSVHEFLLPHRRIHHPKPGDQAKLLQRPAGPRHGLRQEHQGQGRLSLCVQQDELRSPRQQREVPGGAPQQRALGDREKQVGENKMPVLKSATREGGSHILSYVNTYLLKLKKPTRLISIFEQGII